MDLNRPSITRVNDALLGGKDNHAADRAVRDRLLAIDPEFSAALWDVRRFVSRTVRYLVGSAEVRQFLDCGAILPSVENVHDVALRGDPEASVVYASRDPLVLTFGRALLADDEHTLIADVNVTRPERVLADPVVRKALDFTQPVALLHVLTLHHVPDAHDPWAAMAAYVDALAPGSHVIITHAWDPGPDHELAEVSRRAGEAFRAAFGTGWPRSAERILDLLPGLDILQPGLVPVGEWWPDGPRLRQPGAMQRLYLGAVGRKP